MGAGAKLLACVAAGLMLASNHPARHALTATLADAPVSAAGSYTPYTWARAFLASAGEPQTACNLGAVTAWERAEGGAWQNTATGNPLNTTQPEPGSYPINSAGVQAYPSWQAGLAATVTTLGNGRYPGVTAALRAGGDAQAVADAVAGSPWGTGAFTAAC